MVSFLFFLGVAGYRRRAAPWIKGSIIYLRCDRFNPLLRKRAQAISRRTALRLMALIAGRRVDQAESPCHPAAEVEYPMTGRSLIVLTALMAFDAMADTSAILDKDFALMMAWFPGVYDNQEQVYFEDEQNLAGTLRHSRVHTVLEPVDLPRFGTHVFYLQQYVNDDPAQINRQRLYVLNADYERNAVRMQIYTFDAPELLLDAHLNPTQLAQLTMDQVQRVSGCDVLWRRKANQFLGETQRHGCTNTLAKGAGHAAINHYFLLTEDALWISDQAPDENDNAVADHLAGVPFKHRKARQFECWMTATQRDGGRTFRRGLTLHDQGGMIWITTEEENAQQVGIKLRNVRWPYGRNRPSLVLYAHKPDQDRAVSYAWADPGAQRIGINLRWMQASCTLTPQSVGLTQ